MSVVASFMVFRHGQRSPYPPPLGSSAANATPWSSRSLPSAADWNMSEYAFQHQHLNPHGVLLLHHLGEYHASVLGGDLCDIDAVLVADGTSDRDIRSAEAFARGLFPPACVAAR